MSATEASLPEKGCCALCLQSRPLCRSHIIPEFLFETLYDEKHRFNVLSTIPDRNNWMEQKGLREKLLCTECEGRFSKWEDYAAKVLKGGIGFDYRQEGSMVFIEGLDYEKFKLFQMSILWRAGVSTLQFFEKVQLGKHAEILRAMLLADAPGPPWKYGVFMFGIKHEGAILTDMMVQPGPVSIYRHHGYRFVFGGFMWAMLVSSHELKSLASHVLLERRGRLAICVREAAEMGNVVNFGKVLIEMGRM